MNHLPIFTLPNTVLFPGIVIPLHIFEERYKNLINDIKGFENRLILSYAEKQIGNDFVPKLHACVAEVLFIEELKDGKKNIVIEGVEYALLGRMEKSEGEYFISEYERYEINPATILNTEKMREMLSKRVKEISLLSLNFTSTSLELISDKQNIDRLINKIIYFFLFPHEEQQHLLEERYLESKFQYLKSYLDNVLSDIRHNMKTFNFPKSYSKKLN